MFKFAAVTLSLLALVSSSQAWATTPDVDTLVTAPVYDQFTFTSAGGSYSWVLQDTLPTSSLASFTTGINFVVNVPSFPSGQIVFYNDNNLGGLSDNSQPGSLFPPLVNFYSSQIYTGSESNPSFLLGTGLTTETFNGTNNVTLGACAGSCAASLTITQIAAVPEPETYGMMIAGLGLMGFMVRRKKSV